MPVILIDSQDRFVFKPLLYELLTSEIHAEQICIPYTKLLRKNTTFIQDSVQAIDLANQTIKLNSGKQYD